MKIWNKEDQSVYRLVAKGHTNLRYYLFESFIGVMLVLIAMLNMNDYLADDIKLSLKCFRRIRTSQVIKMLNGVEKGSKWNKKESPLIKVEVVVHDFVITNIL